MSESDNENLVGSNSELESDTNLDNKNHKYLDIDIRLDILRCSYDQQYGTSAGLLR